MPYILGIYKKYIMRPFLVRRFYRDIIYRKLKEEISSSPD